MNRHRRQDGWKVHALVLLVGFSVLTYLSPAQARTVGGRAGGGSAGAPRGGVVGSRFGGGIQGGFSHPVHRGAARAGFFHPVRSPFIGPHRFHNRSLILFNFSGFAYPSYPYYPIYPYYPPYPTYPMPYDPGYSGANYPYPAPVEAYTQTAPDVVQVYTAPPEPTPISPRQLMAPTPQSPPPSEPRDDGSLHFEVNPPEAKIFLDDRYIGEARELANIAEITASAGRHLLEIRVGAERTFTEVVVAPHKVTPVRWSPTAPVADPVAVEPESGRLRLEVAPPGTAIYLDGSFATIAESSQPVSLRLPPGRHRVQMVMPGFKGHTADVTVPQGGEAVVAVQLARE